MLSSNNQATDSRTSMGEGQARQAATALLGSGVADLLHVPGGGNNRLYQVNADNGDQYALKSYFSDRSDPRDRLGAEFDGFRFLRQHGIRQVPRPIACDRESGSALYEWVDGEPVDSIGDAELQQAVAFLTELHGLAGVAEARDLPLASEACLSGMELVRQIEHRASRLRAVDHMGLKRFLAEPYADLHDRHIDAAVDGYAATGLDFYADLPIGRQTLSPSDFGFHNALRRKDGSLVFLDFEYFGRDDPVKLTSDFLLHPAMALSQEQKQTFYREMRVVYGSDDLFGLRFRLLYPLYGLRWALILLNAFVPERWRRKAFANGGESLEQVQERQLGKARGMIDHIFRIATEFPNDA